nr:MAG TPA: AAA domain protein [Caudoviricetes sp.]
MNITKGKIAKAQKVVIYGVEGIGKSTLASRFPDPVFIDIEGSTSNMDVARLDKPTSYTMLKNQLSFITANPTVCKTLVIDTVDWVEKMVIEDICMAHDKKDITGFGYGEGFIKLEQEIGRFLNKLSGIVEKGVNVILTAHAIIRKFEQPDEMGAYDRYELKLGNKTTGKTAALVKEWADIVLFCNYKTQVFAVDDKGTKHKAQGGERVMYTAHHPAWDAKNRHGLPFELPMKYESIAHIFDVKTEPVKTEPKAEATAEPVKEQQEMRPEDPIYAKKYDDAIPISVQDLMSISEVTEDELRGFWQKVGHFPKDMPFGNVPQDYWNVLIANWSSALKDIVNARTNK